MGWLEGKGNGSEAPPLRPFPHFLYTAKLSTHDLVQQKGTITTGQKVQIQEGQKTKKQ